MQVRTLEAPLEHVARTRPVTEGVRHLEDWKTMKMSWTSRGTAARSVLTVSGSVRISWTVGWKEALRGTPGG